MENSINSVHFLPFLSVFKLNAVLLVVNLNYEASEAANIPLLQILLKPWLFLVTIFLNLYIVLCLEKKFTLTIYGHCFHSSWESGREMYFWGDFFSPQRTKKSKYIIYFAREDGFTGDRVSRKWFLVSGTNMWEIKGKTLDLWRSKGPVLLLGHFSGCTSPLGWIADVSINAMFFWVIRFILWWNISSSN